MTESPDTLTRLRSAANLVARAPEHETTGANLIGMIDRGMVRFQPDMQDRGRASLTGVIWIGPEALRGSLVGLAQTLVHEYYHVRRQNPLHKTASFWACVLTKSNVMRRYEQPAYAAAIEFLVAVERQFPDLAGDALRERSAVEGRRSPRIMAPGDRRERRVS